MRRAIVVASMAIQILSNELEILEKLFIGAKRDHQIPSRLKKS
jgi:hypothetical protein